MHVPLAALFFFAILTLWIPGYWPTTVFQVGIFSLAGVCVWRARLSPPLFSWPLVPLSFAVFWGLIQCLTGHPALADLSLRLRNRHLDLSGSGGAPLVSRCYSLVCIPGGCARHRTDFYF